MNPSITNSLPSPKRTIGPVPPRDAQGRLRIAPELRPRVKVNELNEPYRDDKGQPVIELADNRQAHEYLFYNGSQVATDEAKKGLQLFSVDCGVEPIMKVYAKNRAEALEVYKREWGITRFSSESADPKVEQIQG